MRLVEPEVYFLAKSQIDENETRAWLDSQEAQEFSLPEDATDAEKMTMLSGKRCYRSFVPGLNPNVTRTRTDMAAFIDNILESKHGSVLEHSSYSFGIENVSRVFTAEMNRHRAGWAISEGSLRFIRFDDISFWMPESLQVDPTDPPQLREAKEASQEVFRRAFKQMEKNYADLEKVWDTELTRGFKTKKKLTSMFRRIIGMGVATGGVWTGNLRAIRHVLSVRVDPAAEEEIAFVFTKILLHLKQEEPRIFGDFHATAEGYKPKYWKV